MQQPAMTQDRGRLRILANRRVASALETLTSASAGLPLPSKAEIHASAAETSSRLATAEAGGDDISDVFPKVTPGHDIGRPLYMRIR